MLSHTASHRTMSGLLNAITQIMHAAYCSLHVQRVRKSGLFRLFFYTHFVQVSSWIFDSSQRYIIYKQI